jgi:hypothetical protein
MAWNMTSVIFGVDSGDANASRARGHTFRGLKPTAKVSRRYCGEELIQGVARTTRAPDRTFRRLKPPLEPARRLP